MSLRQEYIKNKISLHEARKAEVKDWLNENVVFLNERMDRARVKRLINLMLKFDQKFGPFKDKIPGITSIVSDAENALQMALSGRLSNARIGDIFQRLSVIYSILSDFFANDLKVLLQTPAFKVPRTKPEVRLDSITDSGYSPKHITDTFVLTLTPSEEEMVFLNKLYKGITLPQLDRHSIAGQMLGLSYKDLENLCGMEHVPMAVIPDENLLNEKAGWWGRMVGGADIDLKLLKSINTLKAMIPAYAETDIEASLTNLVNQAQAVDKKLDRSSKIAPKETTILKQLDAVIASLKKLATSPEMKAVQKELAKSDEPKLSEAELGAIEAALDRALPNTYRLPGIVTGAPAGLKNQEIKAALMQSLSEGKKLTLREDRAAIRDLFNKIVSGGKALPTPNPQQTKQIVNIVNAVAGGAGGTGVPAGTAGAPQAGADSNLARTVDAQIAQGTAIKELTPQIITAALDGIQFLSPLVTLRNEAQTSGFQSIVNEINEFEKEYSKLGIPQIKDFNEATTAINYLGANDLIKNPEKLKDLNELSPEDLVKVSELSNFLKTDLQIQGKLSQQIQSVSKLFGIISKVKTIHDTLKAKFDELQKAKTPAAPAAAPAAPTAGAPAAGG